MSAEDVYTQLHVAFSMYTLDVVKEQPLNMTDVSA